MWSGPLPSLAVRRYLRHKFDDLKTNYADSEWWSTQLKYHLAYPLHRMYVSSSTEESVRLMDEAWDVLVVLDACRADLFEEVTNLSTFEEYKRVNSGASSTREWVNQQFTSDAWDDTVYISGQPVPAKALQSPFHAFLEPWRDTPADVLATPPELIAETALDAAERYPDKRLLVHFFQPHFGPPETLELLENFSGDVQHVWEALSKGIVDDETVWQTYQENLESVLPVVDQLVDSLDGRVVITSDHGNLFGSRIRPFSFEEVGHPRGLRHPDLVEVPWAVVSGADRDRRDTAAIDSQLSALGYRSD